MNTLILGEEINFLVIQPKSATVKFSQLGRPAYWQERQETCTVFPKLIAISCVNL